jgi:gamma-aminobutyric acid receptor subunit alpha
MSKVSEMDMDYNFDCYFRQSWHDNRLAYRNGPNMIVVNVKLIEHLWKPFTYVTYKM